MPYDEERIQGLWRCSRPKVLSVRTVRYVIPILLAAQTIWLQVFGVEAMANKNTGHIARACPGAGFRGGFAGGPRGGFPVRRSAPANTDGTPVKC